MNNENDNNGIVAPIEGSKLPKGKPVISIVHFVGNGQYETLGTVWDNHRKKGILDLKLDLSKVQKGQPTVRYILFPKDDFRNSALSKLTTNSNKASEEKHRAKPVYDCVIWVKDRRIHVGAIWYNKVFGYLELQLFVYLIPKEFSDQVTIALFPNLNNFKTVDADLNSKVESKSA